MTNKTCCICSGPIEVKRTPEGVVYWRNGENAEPVKTGRCCSACNWTFVIPARLGEKYRGQLPEGIE